MKRATITLSTELEEALDAYLNDQEVVPGLTAVTQAALREFLAARGYLRPFRPLRITADEVGSNVTDASIQHDFYLTEE